MKKGEISLKNLLRERNELNKKKKKEKGSSVLIPRRQTKKKGLMRAYRSY